MQNLNNISYWKQNLGLLPISLVSVSAENDRFIMLNGGYGDFCLQTNDREGEDYFSDAWSSNTKHFVVLGKEKVELYNWKTKKIEPIPIKQVEDNFDKFYKYIVNNNIKTENDIVPFIVNIFKEFRNITQEKNNAIQALDLLFKLLLSLDNPSIGENIRGFDYYIDKLKRGIADIKPQLALIMRHSAGILFQEAQKEVLFFDRQLDFFGNISNKQKSHQLLYSSVHYTPPYLARTIVENAIQHIDLQNKPSLKIFDPACGSSEFLVEVLKQLKEQHFPGNVEIMGYDSSQTAINTSNFLLEYEREHVWKDKMKFNTKLVEDSLAENWENDYDLILMNPPFVSYEQMDKSSREVVKEVLGSYLDGKPNQASAFFYKSVLSLKENGVIGCVIPSSFLSLDAYQKLRKNIYDIINIDLIGKLGNYVFENALTDVSFIIGHKPKNQITTPYVLWTKNEKGIAQNALRDLRKMQYSNGNTVEEKEYSIYKPILFPIAENNWKLISFQESELFKKIERFVLEGKLSRVEDIFDVKQGIKAGDSKVFKLSEGQYKDLPKSERIYFMPVVDNEAVKDGIISKKNYIWYPYNEEGLLIKSEENLRSQAPQFYKNNLFQHKIKLSNLARKDENNWWHLSEHRAWLRKKEARLVSTAFGKSDSFAFDKDGEFVIEGRYGWLPKKEFQDINAYYFYLALFSSPFFDRLLSVYSKQLAGGNWYDLSKKYTKNIPIPNVHNEEMKNSIGYDKLVEIGKDLSAGNSYPKMMIDEILLSYIYPSID